MDVYLSIRTNVEFTHDGQIELDNLLKQSNTIPLFSITKSGAITPKENLFFKKGKLADGSTIYIANTNQLEKKNLCFSSGELEKHLIQFFKILLYAIKKHRDIVKEVNNNIPFPYIIIYFGTLVSSKKIILYPNDLEIWKASASLEPKKISKTIKIAEVNNGNTIL